MKGGLLVLLILIICYACRYDSDSGCEEQLPIYVKSDNLKYRELQVADSLYSCFQTQAALQLYQKLARPQTNDTLALLAAARLSEIKHQSIFLYDEVDLPDSLATKLDKDERDLLFYTKLRKRQLFDIQELKEKLDQAQFLADSITALLNLSTCYYFQEEQLDSSWYYGRQAYDLVVQNKKFSQLHYQVFGVVQSLAKYRRNSYLSVGLMSDAIQALKEMEKVDHVWLSNAYLQRSYAYLSIAEYDKASADGEKVKALEQENLCSILYQSALVGDLYLVGIQDIEEDKIVDKLKSVSESCATIRLNLDRNIGQHLEETGKVTEGISYLESAKLFERNSLFYDYAQQQSIKYMLSTLYEESGQFDKALKVGLVPKLWITQYLLEPSSSEGASLGNVSSLVTTTSPLG